MQQRHAPCLFRGRPQILAIHLGTLQGAGPTCNPPHPAKTAGQNRPPARTYSSTSGKKDHLGDTLAAPGGIAKGIFEQLAALYEQVRVEVPRETDATMYLQCVVTDKSAGIATRRLDDGNG